ncbi:hypothetical protein, partial [Pseudomonas protegens]|uniref:hypothetical protein n=1 Tax=Pseudomonas protegens TaxID=380021 RepID=UPI001C832DC3
WGAGGGLYPYNNTMSGLWRDWAAFVWRKVTKAGIGFAQCQPGVGRPPFKYFVDARFNAVRYNSANEIAFNIKYPAAYASTVHSAVNGNNSPPPLTTPLLVLNPNNALGKPNNQFATMVVAGALTLDFGSDIPSSDGLVVFDQGLALNAKVEFFRSSGALIGASVDLYRRQTVPQTSIAMPPGWPYRFVRITGLGAFGIDAISASKGP